jgi:hypothetical protein
MKQYLILAALASTAVCGAQDPPLAIQRVAEARPAATQTAAAVKPVTTRQLSAQERAELRRQLYQYSHGRSPAKGS